MVEFESRFKYDERTKELTAAKVWTMKGKKEIKEVMGDLNKQKTGIEQMIKKTKESIKDKPEMTEDLTKLKEQLIKLQKIDAGEKLEGQLKDNEDKLKEINKEISKVKEAIGDRLKL